MTLGAAAERRGQQHCQQQTGNNMSFGYNIIEKLTEERFTKENGMIKHFDDGKGSSTHTLHIYYIEICVFIF